MHKHATRALSISIVDHEDGCRLLELTDRDAAFCYEIGLKAPAAESLEGFFWRLGQVLESFPLGAEDFYNEWERLCSPGRKHRRLM